VRPYLPEYATEALAAILRLPRRRAARIHGICGRLAKDPHQKFEPAGLDMAGRPLRFVIIEGVGIRYWVDDAVCLVVIVKLAVPRVR
jgi:hypothetical protein